MPLTRIDSAFLDLDAIGGIDFDVQSGVPTFKVDATTHRVGIGTDSPTTKLEVIGDITVSKQNAFIELKDPDTADANYRLRNQGGSFSIYDVTNNQVKIATTAAGVTIYPNLNANNGLDVMGTITGDGNLDIADGIRHYGDTNTSISFPAADTIAAETDGTERFRITSTGILLKSGQAALTSTSLPHPVQIAADSDAQNIACFGRASDDISAIDFYEADKTTLLGELQYRRDHLNLRHRVGYISFATGGTTERLRITSDGNIGIGTDVVSDKLVVHQGSDDDIIIRVNGADSTTEFAGLGVGAGYASFVAGGSQTTNTDMVLMTTSSGVETERLRITSAGDILIGTETAVTGNVGTQDRFISLSGGSGTGGASQIVFSRNVTADNSSLGGLRFANENNSTDNVTATGQFVASIFSRLQTSDSNAGDDSGAHLIFSTKPESGTLTDRLRIASDGNVGIGTDNPDTLLNLFGTGNATIKVHNNAAGAGTYSRLQFITGGVGSSASSEIRSLRMSAASAATNLAFFTTLAGNTSPTERLSITSTGVVNIGDSSPNADGSGALNVYSDTSGALSQFVHSAGDGGLRLGGTGPGSAANLVFSNNYNSNSWTDEWTIRMDGSDDSLQFLSGGVSGTERLHIKSDGNVGIGTNNPAVKLDVRGTTNIHNELKVVLDSNFSSTKNVARIIPLGFSGNTGARNWALRGVFQYSSGVNLNDAGGDLDLIKSLDRNTILATKKDGSSAGKVGVGTDGPAEKLHVYTTSGTDLKLKIESTATNSYPTLRLTNDARTYDLQIDGATDSFRIWDGTASAQRLTIKSDGNVGIGTYNPVTKLHVLGQGVISTDPSTQSNDYATLIIGERTHADSIASLEFRYNANDFSSKIDGRNKQFAVWTSWNSSSNDRLLVDGTSTTETILLRPGGTSDVIRAQHDTSTGADATYFKGVAHFQRTDTSHEGGDIRFARAVDNAYHYSMDVYGNSATNARLRLVNVTASREDFTLAHGGNIGIGTNDPGEKLTIHNGLIKLQATSGGADTRVEFNRINGRNGWIGIPSWNDDALLIYAPGVSSGNFIAAGCEGGQWTFNGSNGTTTTESLRIGQTGNIGIGTNNPTRKLHVEGKVYFYRGIETTSLASNELQTRSPINSGFYQVDNTATADGWPFTGWAHLTSNTHTNTTNYYAQQFASSFFNQELYFRNTNNGSTTTSQSWGQVMHTNSTLKPVFATSSGSTDAYSRYWYPGGEYYTSVHGITSPGAMNDMIEQGYYHVAYNATNNPTNAYGYLNVHRHMGSHYSLQHFVVSSDTGRQWMRASYPDGSQSSGRNWYQWYSYGALERENQFTNRQHIIGPSSTATFTGLLANTSNNRAQFVLHSDYSDLVISSAQSNNNHGSTLSFVTSDPANAATYNKFVINKGNYGSRTQFLEFGYQNAALGNPHSYVNTTYTMLTLDGANQRVGIGAAARTPSYPLDVRFSGDSGIHAKSSDSHASLYLDAASGNGGYIRFRQGGSDKFWVTNDSSNHMNFRPNGGGTVVRIQNGGQFESFSGAYFSGGMNLANIELDFTTQNNKFIDFYTANGNTVNFRMPTNANVFHTGIAMVRNSGVNLYHANSIKLYTTSTGAYVNGTLGQSSDANLKENIVTVPNALDKVKAMRGVKFNWKKDGRADYGVIAQEAETVVPELVTEGETKKLTQAGSLKKRPDESDYITETQKGFSYTSMVGILIEAMKEQQATIDSLTARIEALENP